MSDAMKDARDAVIRAIAELKAGGVPIPVDLHRAIHALNYAADQKGKV